MYDFHHPFSVAFVPFLSYCPSSLHYLKSFLKQIYYLKKGGKLILIRGDCKTMKVNLKDTALCPGIKNVNSKSIICVAGGLSNFQTSFNSFVFILHLKYYLQIFYTIKGNLVNPRKTIFSFSQPSSLTSICCWSLSKEKAPWAWGKRQI